MSSTNTPRKQSTGPAWHKLAAFALVFVVLAALWRYTPLAGYVTADRVSGWAETLGEVPWGPFAIVLVYTPAAFLMFPRPLITLAAVLALGPWGGFACAFTGIMISAVLSFYVGRILPRDKVRQIAGPRLDMISNVMCQRGFIAVLAARVVPVAPFVVINIVAAALRVKLRHFALGTAIGMLPGVLAVTVFGDQVHAALEDPSTINYWLVAAVLLAFIGMTAVIRRWVLRQNRIACAVPEQGASARGAAALRSTATS